jgi:hypothetical protein
VVNNTVGDVCLLKQASWKAREIGDRKAINLSPKV